MLPIEIVNKILVYVSELNNDIIITQYNMITNKEFYLINFSSDLLWKIKTVFLMKRIYPIYSCDFFNKATLKLYKSGILHYEKQLRIKLHK
jgi:hypothetical protein